MIDYEKNIDMGKALATWWKLADKYNKNLPLHPVVRTSFDGTQKTVYMRKGLIKKSVIETGEKLIRRYIESFNQARRQGLVGTQVPSLSTNSMELGRLFQTSDRTIRAHIAVLKSPAVGFISAYKFRGTRHNFELWISPEVLWSEQISAQSEIQKNAPIAAPAPSENKNLPLKPLETPETLEKEITNVDKGVALQPCALPAGEGACDTFASDTGAQQASKSAAEGQPEPLPAKKPATGGGGAARTGKAAQNAVFVAYVENFWSLACKVLYPGVEFSRYDERQAKIAIWNGVFHKFHYQFTEAEWDYEFSTALERLRLAGNYYENHPDKHAPMPYAVFKPGTGYFDWENERGFRKTNDWLVKQQVWKQQQKVNDALRRAEKEIRLHKQGKLRDELQRKTPLEMFRFQETRLKRFGKAALDKFYAQHAPNPLTNTNP